MGSLSIVEMSAMLRLLYTFRANPLKSQIFVNEI